MYSAVIALARNIKTINKFYEGKVSTEHLSHAIKIFQTLILLDEMSENNKIFLQTFL